MFSWAFVVGGFGVSLLGYHLVGLGLWGLGVLMQAVVGLSVLMEKLEK